MDELAELEFTDLSFVPVEHIPELYNHMRGLPRSIRIEGLAEVFTLPDFLEMTSDEPVAVVLRRKAGLRVLPPGRYSCLIGRITPICVGVLFRRITGPARGVREPFEEWVDRLVAEGANPPEPEGANPPDDGHDLD